MAEVIIYHRLQHDCNTCKHSECDAYAEPCISCGRGSEWEPYTNADRIRAMSVEELAEILDNGCRVLHEKCPNEAWDGSTEPVTACRDCWLGWLKEVSE